MALGIASMLLACGIAGSTYSYFTDHHTSVNEFVLGEVKLVLTEPGWDSGGKAKAS